MNISFVAEKLFSIGSISITNSIVTACVIVFLIFLGITILRSKLSAFRPGSFEIMVEMLYEALYNFVYDILGDKTHKFFGFVVTFFIFILVNNLFSLLPFVPGVGVIEKHESEISTEVQASGLIQSIKAESNPESADWKEIKVDYTSRTVDPEAEKLAADSSVHKAEEVEPTKDLGCLLLGKCILSTKGIVSTEGFVPIFRSFAADLSATITLALISIFVTNAIGVRYSGLRYFKKYFDIGKPFNPINFVVGILELLSEIGKILSFAFRLFGNIFAGEVLLAVITGITFGIATLPFLGLELIVSIIQALVFFLLTAIFIGFAVNPHHGGE